MRRNIPPHFFVGSNVFCVSCQAEYETTNRNVCGFSRTHSLLVVSAMYDNSGGSADMYDKTPQEVTRQLNRLDVHDNFDIFWQRIAPGTK